MSMDDPSQIDTAKNEPTTADRQTAQDLGFWLYSWLGTTAAAGVFGLILDGIVGLFGGTILAGVGAMLYQLTAAFLTWLLWLFRFRVGVAAIAGVLTGIATTSTVFNDCGTCKEFNISFWPAVTLAGLLGALGGGLGGFCHQAWVTRQGVGISRRRSMTSRDVLTRIVALLSVAVAVGSLACFVQHMQQRIRQAECANRLKMISLALAMYQDAHGRMPPAYLTNAAGKPVLSWRVCANQFICYDLDFPKHMDLSHPWDSPKNAAFLDHIGFPFHCPGLRRTDNNVLTDYVAVVGPGTLWPGRSRGSCRSGARAATQRNASRPFS